MILRDPLSDPFGARGRARLIAARHQNGELVAAVPRADVKDAHRGSKNAANLLKDRIADLMPVRVVDRLEVIDISHQHRERARTTSGTLDFLVEPRIKIGPVEQSRQRINGGRVRKSTYFCVAPCRHQP